MIENIIFYLSLYRILGLTSKLLYHSHQITISINCYFWNIIWDCSQILDILPCCIVKFPTIPTHIGIISWVIYKYHGIFLSSNIIILFEITISWLSNSTPILSKPINYVIFHIEKSWCWYFRTSLIILVKNVMMYRHICDWLMQKICDEHPLIFIGCREVRIT